MSSLNHVQYLGLGVGIVAGTFSGMSSVLALLVDKRVSALYNATLNNASTENLVSGIQEINTELVTFSRVCTYTASAITPFAALSIYYLFSIRRQNLLLDEERVSREEVRENLGDAVAWGGIVMFATAIVILLVAISWIGRQDNNKQIIF